MSEEQTQQLLYQMQMLENMFGELTQKERSIINIIREANSAIHSIKGYVHSLNLIIWFLLDWVLL